MRILVFLGGLRYVDDGDGGDGDVSSLSHLSHFNLFCSLLFFRIHLYFRVVSC